MFANEGVAVIPRLVLTRLAAMIYRWEWAGHDESRAIHARKVSLAAKGFEYAAPAESVVRSPFGSLRRVRSCPSWTSDQSRCCRLLLGIAARSWGQERCESSGPSHWYAREVIPMTRPLNDEFSVRVDTGRVALLGDLTLPDSAQGVVLYAHGSGSGRHSPRNQFVAKRLAASGLASLLLDLLTEEEDQAERDTRHLRFNIALLADRLVATTEWLMSERRTASLPVGYFGASTGGGAALLAAARHPDRVAAVVSRGGRPDLAGDALPQVTAPTLLIVGGHDEQVIELNEWALTRLGSPVKQLVMVPGATHLFEEPGTLEEVARLAADWFSRYFALSQNSNKHIRYTK